MATGAAADIVIFDPNTIGSEARGEMRHALPGGPRRLVVEAHGIVYSIVNGRVILNRNFRSRVFPVSTSWTEWSN